MIPLHTERLTLRPLTTGDAEDMFELYSNARVMRFMPEDAHTNVQQTENKLQWDIFVEGSYHWGICLKDTDKVIGKIDYLGGTRFPGMGYLLHPDYWGRGITAEACRAALDYGFEHLGYDRVELWIDETNAQSMRVAQKLGFLPKGRLALKYRHRNDYHYSVVWGMRQSQWRDEDTGSSDTVPFHRVDPVLYVRDIIATTEYYRDKLGFHVDFLYGDPPTHAGVSRGEWSGNLVSLQLSQVAAGKDIIPAANFHIRVGMTVGTLYAQYRDNGVEIVEEPSDEPWGFREFSIRDLNGHVLVLAQYL